MDRIMILVSLRLCGETENKELREEETVKKRWRIGE